jgi:hypothetical protein
MAMLEPTIHVLKYRLLNQSRCIEPTLTTNSQKHSSAHPEYQSNQQYITGMRLTFEVADPTSDTSRNV